MDKKVENHCYKPYQLVAIKNNFVFSNIVSRNNKNKHRKPLMLGPNTCIS